MSQEDKKIQFKKYRPNCEICTHSNVCMYREKYIEIVDYVNDVLDREGFKDAKTNIIGDIIIPCIHFVNRITTR